MMLKFLALIVVSLVLLVVPAAYGQNQTRYIPVAFLDTETGEIIKPLPYRGGFPVCHDPLYSAGLLGPTCFDEADMDDPTPTPTWPEQPETPTPSPIPKVTVTDSCYDPGTQNIPWLGVPCRNESNNDEIEVERPDTDLPEADEEEEQEKTENCGGEPCTPTEKEDSWLDDEDIGGESEN